MKTFNSKHYNTKTKSILLLLLIFSFLTHTVSAQKRWKNYLITGSSMLFSGMLDGTIESINYHYETGVKPRFKNINDQFWNPALSWKNKYKNGTPAEGPKFKGSTTAFVCTTDAYHMLRTTKRATDTFTLVYYVNKTHPEYSTRTSRKKNWKKNATDFFVLTAIRCIGFHITYSLTFKPQKY